MNKKLKCIMLVDDNPDDNFFHTRVIKKCNAAVLVVGKQNGRDALDYLKSEAHTNDEHPDLIFLDINMPGMNGWEFLEEYNKLEKEFKSKVVVIMLTTSYNPDDKLKVKAMNVAYDFKTKPLTKEMLDEVIATHF
jgi:CheY-like chemotaxis protein